MKSPRLDQQNSGQALLELTVVLPLLVFFMAAVLPLISKGKITPWLDERLTLRHFLQNDELAHTLVSSAHEKDTLPSYFKKNALKDTSHIAPGKGPSNKMIITFPGEITRKITTLTIREDKRWNKLTAKKTGDLEQKTSRSLVMVTAPEMSEYQVIERVKRLGILGTVSSMTSILNKAGINFFHINLNALPDSRQDG